MLVYINGKLGCFRKWYANNQRYLHRWAWSWCAY